jgi:hypothetical protein
MLLDRVVEARSDSRMKIFREIMMISCWALWTHRNEVIFDGVRLSLWRWKSLFREEFSSVIHRAKPSLKLELRQWLCNFTSKVLHFFCFFSLWI